MRFITRCFFSGIKLNTCVILLILEARKKGIKQTTKNLALCWYKAYLSIDLSSNTDSHVFDLQYFTGDRSDT